MDAAKAMSPIGLYTLQFEAAAMFVCAGRKGEIMSIDSLCIGEKY